MTQFLNSADWQKASGSYIAGRGWRPANPKALRRAAKPAPSVALAREMRRMAFRIAAATAPLDLPAKRKPRRQRTTTLSTSEYLHASPIERWRSDRVLQRLRYQPDR